MKIQSTKKINHERIKIFVYGLSGSGKTSLLRTIKPVDGKKILCISTESGLLSVADLDIDYIDLTLNDKGGPATVPEKVMNISQCYKMLTEEECKKKYSWVFIDSISEMAQNLLENLKLLNLNEKNGFKLWGDYGDKFKLIIKSFRDLPYYNMVMTSLAIPEKDESGRRYIGHDIQGKIADSLAAYFDEVFYLTVDQETNNRIFVTGNTNVVIAKDRSGKLLLREPADLSVVYNKITKQNEGDKKDDRSNTGNARA